MIDIIIPVKSTNLKFIDNIQQISRNDWVNKIYVGDSGVPRTILNELKDIAKVTVIDQVNIHSQGKCITELAEMTNTEYFAYFHGDVTIPADWLEAMMGEIEDSAILECRRIYQYEITATEAEEPEKLQARRPLSGTQLISREKFLASTGTIDDDYLFRNEDLVFSSLVQQAGFRYGKTAKTYHVHQIGFARSNENVSYDQKVKLISTPTISDLDMFRNQLKGLIKYASSNNSHCKANFDLALSVFVKLGGDIKEIKSYSIRNSAWRRYLRGYTMRMLLRKIRAAVKIIKSSNFDYFIEK